MFYILILLIFKMSINERLVKNQLINHDFNQNIIQINSLNVNNTLNFINDLEQQNKMIEKKHLNNKTRIFIITYDNNDCENVITSILNNMYYSFITTNYFNHINVYDINNLDKIQKLLKKRKDTNNLLNHMLTSTHFKKDNNLIDNDEALSYIKQYIKLENTFENNNNSYLINKHKYLYVCSINCSKHKIIFCSKDTYTILKNNIDYLYFILENLKNNLNVHYDKNIIEIFGNKNLVDEYINLINNNKDYYNELSTFINIFLNSHIFKIEL